MRRSPPKESGDGVDVDGSEGGGKGFILEKAFVMFIFEVNNKLCIISCCV